MLGTGILWALSFAPEIGSEGRKALHSLEVFRGRGLGLRSSGLGGSAV